MVKPAIDPDSQCKEHGCARVTCDATHPAQFSFDKRVARGAARLLETALRMAERRPGFSVRNHLESIQLHFEGYAEQGMSDPDCGIIATGNWHDVDVYDRDSGGLPGKTRKVISTLPSRLCQAFAALGIETEWSDEWTTCDECSRLVRTQPDSHSWRPSYRDTGDGVTCLLCLDEPEAIDAPEVQP